MFASNAEKTWRALQEFGAPLFDLTLADLQTPGIVFQMGMIPSRVDVIMDIDGANFEEAWTEHKIVESDGMQIPVIGITQLFINKKATARPKDRNDILWMETEYEK